MADGSVPDVSNRPPFRPRRLADTIPLVGSKQRAEDARYFKYDPSIKGTAACELAGVDLQAPEPAAIAHNKSVCQGCPDCTACLGFALQGETKAIESGQEIQDIGMRGKLTTPERQAMILKLRPDLVE